MQSGLPRAHVWWEKQERTRAVGSLGSAWRPVLEPEVCDQEQEGRVQGECAQGREGLKQAGVSLKEGPMGGGKNPDCQATGGVRLCPEGNE